VQRDVVGARSRVGIRRQLELEVGVVSPRTRTATRSAAPRLMSVRLEVDNDANLGAATGATRTRRPPVCRRDGGGAEQDLTRRPHVRPNRARFVARPGMRERYICAS
jgi:hypothetical protein